MGQLSPPPRLPSLDLLRGVAVLGILAINIHGFAGPTAAVLTPHAVHPPTWGGDLAYALGLVLFEGKMRAVFTIVFGASMLAYISRAENRGADGERLQLHRLLWLAPLGYVHYLLWWGDILFLYAAAGIVALILSLLPTRIMVMTGLALFTLWQADGIARHWPLAEAELASTRNTASAAQQELLANAEDERRAGTGAELERAQWSLPAQVAWKLGEDPSYPVRVAIGSLGETVPYMLIGMALFRLGLFAGTVPQRTMVRWSLIALASGTVPTLAFAGWTWSAGFPPGAMTLGIEAVLAFPHLLMALGLMGLLAARSSRIAATAIGQRLCAAGRLALSNYLGTTLVMSLLFQGWGLGLFAKVPVAAEPLFVLLGWLLMLGWSKPWSRHFVHGPAEWLWRSLAEGQRLPFIRKVVIAKGSH